MNKRAKILKIWIVVTAMLLCISGCGIKGNSNVTDNESGLVEAETESKMLTAEKVLQQRLLLLVKKKSLSLMKSHKVIRW